MTISVLPIPLATLNDFLDKAPCLNISNDIWILSSDTLIPFDGRAQLADLVQVWFDPSFDCSLN